MQLDLFFANPQPHWADACAQAHAALRAACVGKTRGRFVLLRHEPVPWNVAGGPAQALSLPYLLETARHTPPGGHVGVQLLTPLRLKGEHGLVQQAPAALFLLRRLLARAAMLAGVRAAALPLADSALEQVAALRLTQQDLHWDDLTRYSARQQAELPLGGLTGWLRYSSHEAMDAVCAWLAMGEWLHVGTKTTFGLGAYRLAPGRASRPA